MCPKSGTVSGARKDMSREDFRSLLPYLDDVENVVLEGWGESLLHDRLHGIIRDVKQRGARAGFVTCGTGLDGERIRLILDAGIDFIGFSLAGSTAETHNGIRIGSDFDALVSSMRLFVTTAVEKRLTPRTHVVFLLLKSNLGELNGALELARRVGIRELVCINPTHVGDRWQERERVFSCGDGSEQARALLKQAARSARRMGIALHLPAVVASEVPVCSENPLKNLYISAEGDLSPCVFMNPPVKTPFTRFFCGEERTVDRVSYGNIFSQQFERIWNSPPYSALRETFNRRTAVGEESYRSLLRLQMPGQQSMPAPPEQCTSCHKILGL
jgi:MoaA/NifB/PqqE/SkfB family radical SAM enzyme